MSRTRYKILQNDLPHFLTCTVVHWVPVFTHPEAVTIILDSLRFLQKEERLCLYAYVIMDTHLHLVASSVNLSKEIGDFKSFTAHQILDWLRIQQQKDYLLQFSLQGRRFKKDREYQLWQEGSHPQQIHDCDMMRQKIEYIHNNPVRRGYVDKATDWRYSSARNYAGVPALLRVTTEW